MKPQYLSSRSYKRLRDYNREQHQDRVIKLVLLIIVGAALMYALVTV